MSCYVPLWCKSNFSFLEGASHPDELVDEAYRVGLPALALTDRDGVYGVVRAHVKAREVGLKLIIGSEITVNDGSTVVLLAQDRGGYANLCRLITKGRRRSEKGESAVGWDEVCAHAPGLMALWGGVEMNLDSRLRGNDGKEAGRGLTLGEADFDKVTSNLHDAFADRLYGMLARHRREEEVVQESRLRERAKRFGIPLVATNEVLYHNPSRRRLQDVLTSIRHGVPVAACGRKLKPNAEYELKPPYAFARLFADDPAAVETTLEIAERCNFSLDEIRYRYPSEELPDGMTSTEWLRRQAFNGARWRYGDSIPEIVAAQLEKELEIIEALDYPGYFLTMWEIVEFCRANDILCQGRGSAANSVVCYCLGITAIDPVRMGLRYVKSLGEGEWARIAAARRASRFVSLEDVVRRSALDEGSLSGLAEAGAFDSLGVTRRNALWDVRRLIQTRNQSLTIVVQETNPGFTPLSDFEEVGWDYRRTAHSARRHPLEPMRAGLIHQGLPDARTVASMQNGEKIRYAGLVICRQRPGTAGGVVFMTLEDETGFVNVVIWESVFQRYAVLAKTVSFLGISGKLQVEDGVVHLVAERLWEPRVELKPASARSRDFH